MLMACLCAGAKFILGKRIKGPNNYEDSGATKYPAAPDVTFDFLTPQRIAALRHNYFLSSSAARLDKAKVNASHPVGDRPPFEKGQQLVSLTRTLPTKSWNSPASSGLA